MQSIINQEYRQQEELQAAIKPIQDCITSLIACDPKTIIVYPSKIVTEIHPVYQKEITGMERVRDEFIRNYLSKHQNKKQ